MTNFGGSSFEQNMAQNIAGIPLRADLAHSAVAFMKNVGLCIVDSPLQEATENFWSNSDLAGGTMHSFTCDTSRGINLHDWLAELNRHDLANQFAGRVLVPNLVEVKFRGPSARYSISQKSQDDDYLNALSLEITEPWDLRRGQWEAVIFGDDGFDSDEGPLAVFPEGNKMTAEGNNILGFITASIEGVLQGSTFRRNP